MCKKVCKSVYFYDGLADSYGVLFFDEEFCDLRRNRSSVPNIDRDFICLDLCHHIILYKYVT